MNQPWKPSTRDHAPSTLRAALWLSAMPALLGCFFIFNGRVNALGLGCVGPFVRLAAAWAAFVGLAWCLSILLQHLLGPGFALKTKVICPKCSAQSPIICLRCTQCRHELGVPKASKATYIVSMLAWVAFLLVLFGRPETWFG